MSKRSDFEAPSPPRPRRADSRLIVESILEAALELGLDASMLSIAERAGVGAASLHRYFPTRRALHAELGRTLYRRVATELAEVLAAADTVDAAIWDACRLGIELPFANDGIRREMHGNLPFSWVREDAESATDALHSVLSFAMVARMGRTPEEADLRAHTSLALVRGVIRTRLLMPDRAPPVEVELPLLVAAVKACTPAIP